MTRVLDSSLLLAAFDEADERRGQAVKALAKSDPIEVPPEVLAETLGLVQRRHKQAAAARLLDQLKKIPHLALLETTDHAATENEWRRSPGLSWVDAAVVAWCRRRHAVPLSYDEDITRAAAPPR